MDKPSLASFHQNAIRKIRPLTRWVAHTIRGRINYGYNHTGQAVTDVDRVTRLNRLSEWIFHSLELQVSGLVVSIHRLRAVRSASGRG